MVRFGKGDYTIELENWSKHHKEVGVLFQREYENGEVIATEDKKIQGIVGRYADDIRKKEINTCNVKTGKMVKATDFYLMLDNLDYVDSEIEYYSIGSANTEQTMGIRAKFQIEDYKFILEKEFTSSGTFAMSFSDLIENNFLEELLDDVDSEYTINNNGIEKSEVEYSDYKIMAVDKYGDVVDLDVESHEITKSLVGIEIFEFDLKITD